MVRVSTTVAAALLDSNVVAVDVDHARAELRGRRRVERGDGRGVGGSSLHVLLLLSLLWLHRLKSSDTFRHW